MKRKQELWLIIRQLKTDLCRSAANIKRNFPILNEDSMDDFKKAFRKHQFIHDELVFTLNEYNKL